MVINSLDATSAYSQVGSLLESGSSASSSSGGQSFSDTLKNVATDTIKQLHEGEGAATQAVSGTGNLANVVTAIDNAELLLTQITALRDKAITAYQSITSSAI